MYSSKELLKTESLSAGYEGRAVLYDVSFSLCRGEIMVVVGPNGAGKSTLLKTISGLLPPIGGDVELATCTGDPEFATRAGDPELASRVGDPDLTEADSGVGKTFIGTSIFSMDPMERARHMSLLLTDKRMAELMTCRDVVEMGRYPYTGRLGILSQNDLEVVDEVMERLSIKKLSDMFFDKISDGQRQRVLLARALCQKPRILILDEPASYLDIRYQLELLDILRQLADDGLSVIMSMHELSLVKRIADRLLCVKDGYARMVEDTEGFYENGGMGELFDIPDDKLDYLK